MKPIRFETKTLYRQTLNKILKGAANPVLTNLT